jgi:dihydrofolate synthase/folylpolyglutamate synthase
VILDGAHNDPGVRALCRYMDDWLKKEKTVLLTGVMEDKDVAQMTKRLAGRVSCVVAAQPDVPRAMDAEKLAQAFAQHGVKTYAQADVKDALKKARALAGPEGTVLCAGSLYLIGALRTLLKQEKEFADVI